MAWASEAIPEYFQDYLGEPDERVRDWFLVNSPLNLIIIYVVYFSFILFGLYFMSKRKPFELRGCLVVYNCIQIAIASYIFEEIVSNAILAKYKLICTPLDTSYNRTALRIAKTFWLFYISKIVDLFDTVFFVLRKKNQQLSFLHVYHHSTMIFNWYLGVLYTPGGQATLSVAINSFVHIIMYTYYLLSSFGPRVQKYLWWKKYLTQLQLFQFIIILLHLVIGSINGCQKPIWLVYFSFLYLWSMVFLFLNFYATTYDNERQMYLKAIKEKQRKQN
ncbi:hypothetical protein PPYR_11637 [Photinus pyralis]|uniref:Elongation of very long chain fatty acids protein n=1 Tax=Photinus pyralis TaxID=7054 RepID=A0A5N4AC20_PHOPY|nr:elongation of very long chain fatty acids protein 4-like [Photinus pyralis]KAB0794798.1 hypothetical protein PPYR_11637 [Photinus pyralis]